MMSYDPYTAATQDSSEEEGCYLAYDNMPPTTTFYSYCSPSSTTAPQVSKHEESAAGAASTTTTTTTTTACCEDGCEEGCYLAYGNMQPTTTFYSCKKAQRPATPVEQQH